jgi:hypothetical protein
LAVERGVTDNRDVDDGEVSEDGNEDFISDYENEQGGGEGSDDEDTGSSYHVPSDLDDSFD